MRHAAILTALALSHSGFGKRALYAAPSMIAKFRTLIASKVCNPLFTTILSLRSLQLLGASNTALSNLICVL
jgi:hypothetical protein